MFESFLEDCVGSPDATLDERLRANELELRRLMAERAALISVIEHRGAYRDEHRSMAAYLRATSNCSTATVTRERKLARLLTDHPEVGDALWDGHITVDHVVQICRLQSNPRIRGLLPAVMPVLVDLAEHSSHREFDEQITGLIAALDQDGAFSDIADAVEGRRASVVEVGGTLVASAHGGDPVQAARMQTVFAAFADLEYRKDLEARRAEHGDDAELHPLPRTHAQRGFDALVAIFATAYTAARDDVPVRGSSEVPELAGPRLPELVVNLLVDDDTMHETLAHAGIVLPGGDQLELGDTGLPLDEPALLEGLAGELADQAEAFLDRRCETPNGSPIHPSIVLRALLTGHVRREVLDSRGVVVDYGTKQRLFTGLARQAAMLLAKTCEFPGCDLPASWSQVDHNHEWSDGGRTDQDNARIGCGHHNRLKHRRRWKTRRDRRGRTYTIRADGTIILPVGERPPDLSIDEYTDLARQRLRALRPSGE
jgi:hypothetical protein